VSHLRYVQSLTRCCVCECVVCAAGGKLWIEAQLTRYVFRLQSYVFDLIATARDNVRVRVCRVTL
jgi:hypothetical protein